MLDLDAIKARVEDLHMGPWTSYPNGITVHASSGIGDMRIATCAGFNRAESIAIADFITQARENIPALLAELEIARALIKLLEENAVMAEERHEAEVERLRTVVHLAHDALMSSNFGSVDPRALHVIKQAREATWPIVREQSGVPAQ
jgi:hypothetical protein